MSHDPENPGTHKPTIRIIPEQLAWMLSEGQFTDEVAARIRAAFSDGQTITDFPEYNVVKNDSL